MRLSMLMHGLCFMHIVCMFAAYGLQACMPHGGVVLVLSVMLCTEGLEETLVIPALCSQLCSYHNMTLPGSGGLLLYHKNTGAQ